MSRKARSDIITGYAGHDDISFSHGDHEVNASYIFVVTDSDAVPVGKPLSPRIALAVDPTAKMGDQWHAYGKPGELDVTEAELPSVLKALSKRGALLVHRQQTLYNAVVNDIVSTIAREWEKITPNFQRYITPEQMRRMVEVVVELQKQPQQGFFYEPETNLRLPPAAGRPLFGDRGRDPITGKRLKIDQFLAQTWGDYTSKHLLFSGDLRNLDEGAYQALRYRARELAASQGRSFEDVFPEVALRFGVMTTEHLHAPPSGLERSAELLKRAQALKKVKNLAAAARRITDEGPARH